MDKWTWISPSDPDGTYVYTQGGSWVRTSPVPREQKINWLDVGLVLIVIIIAVVLYAV